MFPWKAQRGYLVKLSSPDVVKRRAAPSHQLKDLRDYYRRFKGHAQLLRWSDVWVCHVGINANAPTEISDLSEIFFLKFQFLFVCYPKLYLLFFLVNY